MRILPGVVTFIFQQQILSADALRLQGLAVNIRLGRAVMTRIAAADNQGTVLRQFFTVTIALGCLGDTTISKQAGLNLIAAHPFGIET